MIFNDQKLPVYIYLTALSVAAFGLNEFAVRFPSALLGSVTVLLLYFVVKRLTTNTILALLSAFLLAITPWHILFSRAAFETNAALAFVVCGVWLFLVGVQSKNRDTCSSQSAGLSLRCIHEPVPKFSTGESLPG